MNRTDSASAAGVNAQVPQVQRGYAEALLNETGTQKTTKDEDNESALLVSVEASDPIKEPVLVIRMLTISPMFRFPRWNSS